MPTTSVILSLFYTSPLRFKGFRTISWPMQALTERQALFVAAYVRSGNGTAACEEAGYRGPPANLAAHASDLLRKPHIQRALAIRLAPVIIAAVKIGRLVQGEAA